MGIAAQMYTVREFVGTADGLAATLSALRAIGYEAVQLSAIGAMNGPEPAVTASQGRKLLDENGLRCIATHRSWDDLVYNTEHEIDFHHTLGCDFAAIGGIPGRYGDNGEDGCLQFIRDAAPVIARLKQEGIRFGYHNHAHEFQRLDLVNGGRRSLYDLFIEEAGPDLMLEIDVYWVQHAGLDPVRLMERCHGRVPVIHVKDKEVVAKEGPVMAPIGEGNLDWSSILPACQAAGVEWYAVEQDVCRRDPLDCLRASYDYLKTMGL